MIILGSQYLSSNILVFRNNSKTVMTESCLKNSKRNNTNKVILTNKLDILGENFQTINEINPS